MNSSGTAPRAVNPRMLTLARESMGWTQKELADKLSSTQSFVSKIEAGVIGVAPGVILRLAEILGYPEEFFFEDERIYGFGVSEMFHRKRTTVPNRALLKVRAQANVVRMHFQRMLRNLEFDEPLIPRMDIDAYGGRAPEIARAVRAAWQLPAGPVQNVTEVLEQAGAVVIPLDFETRQIDACSMWPLGMPPLIFVNLDVPGDRLRYSLCHELGHLVMHQFSDPDAERQADLFASEFLMPERDIKVFLKGLTLQRLAALKMHWKVSMAALLQRASQLHRITENQARYLWAQMSKAGYRTREPAHLDIPREQPSVYKQIVSLHCEQLGYSLSELGKLVLATEHQLQHYYLNRHSLLRAV